MLSLVIPAHNEALVIARCLESATAGARPEELDVVVVCNGCTDDTAAIARAFPFPSRIIETPVASKTLALNLADRIARGFPRFYLDADAVVTWPSICAVVEAMKSQAGLLAAAPKISVDVNGSSWPVRAFYQAWLELPYFHTGMIGSGLYVLSEAGRARFGDFPETLAEDSFVRLLFHLHERCTVTTAEFTIFAPSNLRNLIAIKTRGRVGGLQLAAQFPHLAAADRKPYLPALMRILRQPRLWAGLPVYFAITALTRIRARHRLQRGDLHWDQDQSSRDRFRTESYPPGTS